MGVDILVVGENIAAAVVAAGGLRAAKSDGTVGEHVAVIRIQGKQLGVFVLRSSE